jgi:prolyl-tRNA synthetase
VNLILAGLAETKHDDQGLIWPLEIAPYEVIVSVIGANEADTLSAAEQFYSQLQSAGVDVLLDDRDLRPGVKFKDADLIGIPLRVNFGGKGLKEGIVELKWRTSAESEKVLLADALKTVVAQLAEKRKAEAEKLATEYGT